MVRDVGNRRGLHRRCVRDKLLSKPCSVRLDTECMTLAALSEQVGETLARAHSLFGDPPESGGSAALDARSRLVSASESVRGGLAQTSGLSGQFATDYRRFAGGAGARLDGLAALDNGLSDQLGDAANTDRTGRATSGGVVIGAATDTAGLAPFTTTPAGQKALLTALRARLAQQQRVVAAYKIRDARMAALLRSMAYAGRTRGGGAAAMPLGGSAFGTVSPAESGGKSARGGLSGLGGLAGVARGRGQHPAVLASRIDRRAAAVAPGPGGAAAAVALSKRGAPYVWGAKGPDRFDCSGLTEWAWAQAGVRLGPDTYTQVNQGVPVAPGDVRAGDLIFPQDSWDDRGPSHVQLAISPTQVVHAPQPGDVVRIAPMPSSYVARRPVPVSPSTEN
jgi:cell wall-associated NlpC family hydrolase